MAIRYNRTMVQFGREDIDGTFWPWLEDYMKNGLLPIGHYFTVESASLPIGATTNELRWDAPNFQRERLQHPDNDDPTWCQCDECREFRYIPF